MDVEVFVHGVPMGQCFWGEPSEKDYLSLFYSGSQGASTERQMIVKSRKVGGKPYFYYNFIVPSLRDSQGRSGSYFGLTVRLDRRCMDVPTMYSLLDAMFRKHILGPVIRGGYYVISDFKNVDSLLKTLQQNIYSLISSVFPTGSFVEISEVISGTESRRVSPLDDVSGEAGPLVVDPSVPGLGLKKTLEEAKAAIDAARAQARKAEMDFSDRLRMKEEETIRRIKAVEQKAISDNAEIRAENASLKNELNATKAQISSLKEQLRNREAKIERLEDVNERLEVDIRRLKDGKGGEGGTGSRPQNRALDFIRRHKEQLIFGLLTLVLISCLLVWYFYFRPGKSSRKSQHYVESPTSLRQETRSSIDMAFKDATNKSIIELERVNAEQNKDIEQLRKDIEKQRKDIDTLQKNNQTAPKK